MKIYRVNDLYRGYEKWFSDKPNANFTASLWEAELDLDGHSGVDYITITEFKNKSDLLDCLNDRAMTANDRIDTNRKYDR